MRYLMFLCCCFLILACESAFNPITQAQQAFSPAEELSEEARLARMLMVQDFNNLQPFYAPAADHPIVPLAPENCDYCWFAYGYGPSVALSKLHIRAKALLRQSLNGTPCLEVQVFLPQSAAVPPASLYCFLPEHDLKDAEGTDLELWSVSTRVNAPTSAQDLGLTALAEDAPGTDLLFAPYEAMVAAPPTETVYRFFFAFSAEQDLVGPVQGDLTIRLEQGAFASIGHFTAQEMGQTIETDRGSITLLGINENRVAFNFEGYDDRERIQVWATNEKGEILGPAPSFRELPQEVDPYQPYQLVYTRQNDFFTRQTDPTLPLYLVTMAEFYERFALPEQSIDNHLGRPFYLRRLDINPTSVGFYWLAKPDTLSKTLPLSN